MGIAISQHAKIRATERGTNKEEILEVYRSGFNIPAKYNRRGKAKIFHLGQLRDYHYYEQKRVEIFYAVENDDIIISTVYVFYGKWE